MKGDFSRITGPRASSSHYNSVLKQQGRVQLDSDWNELNAIIAHQRRIRTIDVIGDCGAPLHAGGFKIVDPGDGSGLLISSGRMYVGGLLAETTPSTYLPIIDFVGSKSIRVYDHHINGVSLDRDDWVLLTTRENPDGLLTQVARSVPSQQRIEFVDDLDLLNNGEHSDPKLWLLIPYEEQTDLPVVTPIDVPSREARQDLVYLEVWERHLTATEVPDLREVALGGPDTDTRARTIAQVKILTDVGDHVCGDKIDAWDELTAPADGRLTTKLTPDDTGDDPCAIGERGGYQGLENRLYRVEIHEGGSDGVSFKWSRTNAAQTYAIEEFVPTAGGANSQLRLAQQGKDAILSIRVGDFIEVSNEQTDLDTKRPGVMVQVTTVSDRVITVDADVSVLADGGRPKVRRWDTDRTGGLPLRTINAGDDFELEDGISICFDGDTFQSGDYWVFAARTLTGDIEILDRAIPQGIERHFCRLAILRWGGGELIEIEDCRPVFPPLTKLPEGGGQCCHICVSPDDTNWWLPLTNLPKGTHLFVCFEPGNYELSSTITFEELGNVVFFGAGSGSQVEVLNHEAAFVFKRCDGVTIRDLFVYSVNRSSGNVEEEKHLNGAITILNCGLVRLESVIAGCADSDSDRTEASCITVRNEEDQKPPPGLILNVRNCEFQIGRNQVGLLIVNPTTCHIEANYMIVREGRSAAAKQGIVVAGILSPQVHILQNMISGVLQGIHLGFSNNKRSEPEVGYFLGDKIEIHGNQILTTVLSAAHEKRGRHGIFVGNSKDLSIKDNFIRVVTTRSNPKVFPGIHVAGHWGRKMIIEHNHLEGNFGKRGILVDAIEDKPNRPLWYVQQNVATVLALDAEIVDRENV